MSGRGGARGEGGGGGSRADTVLLLPYSARAGRAGRCDQLLRAQCEQMSHWKSSGSAILMALSMNAAGGGTEACWHGSTNPPAAEMLQRRGETTKGALALAGARGRPAQHRWGAPAGGKPFAQATTC